MISLADITQTCKGATNAIIEGEEYFRTGLLTCVGITKKSHDRVKCVCLAAESSGISSCLHEVEVEINTLKDVGERIENLKCVCSESNLGQCKHCIALLIYLNRINEAELDDLTSIDLDRQWDNLKKAHQRAYEAKKMDESSHVEVKMSSCECKVTEELRKKWRRILLKCTPSKPLASIT